MLSATDGLLFLELFLQAHIVVQIVIIILIIASLRCWVIIFEKLVYFHRARKEADSFEAMFWSAHSLDELYADICRSKPPIATAALFIAAMREWNRSTSSEGGIKALNGTQMRVEKVMDVTIGREMDRLEQRLIFLATVGSTAPFLGLFATVWEIMGSFQAIAVSKTTSLAIVAPGLAEALFATAIGLIAALPAVVFYNKFLGEVARVNQRLEAFADEFSAIVSRQIDTTNLG
ncbi:MAG: protein TolQ [Hyphomicrobiaceae bacterium]|nr:protein TolQ [Hyphomicrobiaceae bacterium]